MSRPELIVSIKDTRNNTKIDIVNIYGSYETFYPIDDKERILTHNLLNEWSDFFKEQVEFRQKKLYFIERGNDDPDYLYNLWQEEKLELEYIQSILNYIETLHQIMDNLAYDDYNPKTYELVYWFSY